jgi:hypothetical protein
VPKSLSNGGFQIGPCLRLTRVVPVGIRPVPVDRIGASESSIKLSEQICPLVGPSLAAVLGHRLFDLAL